MAGRDQVEEVKQKTDIVTIIGEHIDLKKAGRNFKANCPFHGERTPSFMVSPELQIYKCFGCSETGDVFTFLEKQEGMEFYEALQYLAKRAGVKLKPIQSSARSEKQKIYETNLQASRFYQYILEKTDSGKAVMKYLLNQRGLSPETIKEFSLGFAPNEYGALSNYLIKKKSLSAVDLEQAGLTLVSRGRAIDRFRGRIMFPLFDHRGNVIGFSGRIMPSEKRTDLAKYINSPETPAYQKGYVIYGLNFSKRSIKKKNYALVVEGNVDVLSLWQAGYKNIVAITGTAFTEDQVRLLSRYTNRLIIAFDPDMAGNAAAIRGINEAQKQGFEIKVAKIKGYADPDEMVRNDPKAFKETLKSAVGVWDFIIGGIFEGRDLSSGLVKQQVSGEVVPILASIPDQIVKAHYVKQVSTKLNVPVQAVTEQIEKIVLAVNKKGVEVVKPTLPKTKTRRELLEERLMVLAFQSDPEILLKKSSTVLVETIIGKRIMEEYKKYTKTNKKYVSTKFLGGLPEELKQWFLDIVMTDTQGLTDNPDELEKELKTVINELKIMIVKDHMQEITMKLKKAEQGKNNKDLKILQGQFDKMTKKLSVFKETQ